MQEELARSIALQIKLMLLRNSMTQGDLARAMGQGQPSVSMMLSRGSYTLQTLCQVATALDCKLEITFTKTLPHEPLIT